MLKKFSGQAVAVATGLWPVELKVQIAFPMTGRPAGPWLQV
jgi:hypothetical protein